MDKNRKIGRNMNELIGLCSTIQQIYGENEQNATIEGVRHDSLRKNECKNLG